MRPKSSIPPPYKRDRGDHPSTSPRAFILMLEIRYHPSQGMGCIIYEIIIFVLSHKNDQPAFSKNSAPRTVFENLSFCCPKTPFTCGRRAKTEDKNLRFQECSDTWGLGLELIFCFFVIVLSMWLQNTRFFVCFSFVLYRVIAFFVILTSFFINFLLPRVLQIEIHNKLLITLYLIPSKSVAGELSFKFGPEALDFWSTNSIVRTGFRRHRTA